MEDIYQSIANAEKGLEASLLDVFKGKGEDLKLNEATSTSKVQNCAGLTFFNNTEGTCVRFTYTPQQTDPWSTNKDNFTADVFIFYIDYYGETLFKMKDISDGKVGKSSRTVLIGSGR